MDSTLTRPEPRTDELRPPPPRELGDVGLPGRFLPDLILKTFYVRGALSGDRLAGLVRLPFWALEDQLVEFQERKLIEVIRSEGLGRHGYTFELTGEGRTRARILMETAPYVGPAPVPMDQYRKGVDLQSIRKVHIGPDSVEKGLDHLVLDAETIELLGPAVNAARSVFLFGEPGNGKTTISEAVVKMFGDHLYIPYAVFADGQVIQLFDPVVHHPVDDAGLTSSSDPASLLTTPPDYDRRYVKIERPMVLSGGELTLDQLELTWDPEGGLYQAPPQMKANGGVFVIDDFGRQRTPPRDLLNRWMVPLDRGIDFLTFRSGQRAMIPFATLVMFATNLNPEDLVDEAFLRRIRHKIEIRSPKPVHFSEIFRRQCERKGIPFRAEAVDWIYREYYTRLDIEPRGCHPVDLVSEVMDLASFLGRTPDLSIDMLEKACRTYFISMPESKKGTETHVG